MELNLTGITKDICIIFIAIVCLKLFDVFVVTRLFYPVFYLILASRFYLLNLKPPHHDESINGWFVHQIWANGYYQYDPQNYHGPLFFYLLQIAEIFGGAQVSSYRFISLLFSCLTLLYLSYWTRIRLKLSWLWLVPLLLSTGFLFFSRSAIHESMLVFFISTLVTSWLDIWVYQKKESWPLLLVSIVMGFLVNETFLIVIVLGLIVSALPLLKNPKKAIQIFLMIKNSLFENRVLLFGLTFFWLLMMTGFGRNPQGFLDFFIAYLPWFKTGMSGAGHNKEGLYFLKLFYEYDLGTFACLILTILGVLVFTRQWIRQLCLWSLFNFIVYSLIPYKTPWCLISLQIPLWLSAVAFVSHLNFLLRGLSFFGVIVLSALNLQSFYSLNYTRYEKNHPYIYVQTTYQAKDIVENIFLQISQNPNLLSSRMWLATEEPWPFPWWLGVLKNQISQKLDDKLLLQDNFYLMDQEIYLIDYQNQEAFEKKLNGRYWRRQFQVRDSRELSLIYLKSSQFECPLVPCDEVLR